MNGQGPIPNTTRELTISKCFTITKPKKVNSYKERKNNSYNTEKLSKGHCKKKLKKTMKTKALTKR